MKLRVKFNGSAVNLTVGDKEALTTLYNHGAICRNRRSSGDLSIGVTEYLNELEKELSETPVQFTIPKTRFDRFLDSLISLRLSLDDSLTDALKSLHDGGRCFAAIMRRLEQEWITEHTN